jgi:hypothetical protein
LLIFRTLLGVESGDGEPPPIIRNRKGKDGQRYNVLPGGKPGLAAPAFHAWVEGNLFHARGTVRSREELRRLTRRLFAKHGIAPERLDEITTTTSEQMSPAIEVDVTLREEARRAIAKMACNLLATERRELFLHSDFDGVRRYVAEGVGSHVAICAPLDKGSSKGDFDHLILVSGSATTGQVRALVTLYGRLHFVVDFGITHALSSDVRLSYRVDPLNRRERRHAVEDRSMEVPPFAPDDGPQGSVWMAAVTDLLRATIRQVEMARAFEECWAEAFKGNAEGDEITEQEMRMLSHLVVERFIPRFYTVKTRR